MLFEEETKLMAKYGLTIDKVDEDWRELLDTYQGHSVYMKLLQKWIAPALQDEFIRDHSKLRETQNKVYNVIDQLKLLVDTETINIIFDVLADARLKQ